jgi:hypothetical protein
MNEVQLYKFAYFLVNLDQILIEDKSYNVAEHKKLSTMIPLHLNIDKNLDMAKRTVPSLST